MFTQCFSLMTCIVKEKKINEKYVSIKTDLRILHLNAVRNIKFQWYFLTHGKNIFYRRKSNKFFFKYISVIEMKINSNVLCMQNICSEFFWVVGRVINFSVAFSTTAKNFINKKKTEYQFNYIAKNKDTSFNFSKNFNIS